MDFEILLSVWIFMLAFVHMTLAIILADGKAHSFSIKIVNIIIISLSSMGFLIVIVIMMPTTVEALQANNWKTVVAIGFLYLIIFMSFLWLLVTQTGNLVVYNASHPTLIESWKMALSQAGIAFSIEKTQRFYYSYYRFEEHTFTFTQSASSIKVTTNPSLISTIKFKRSNNSLKFEVLRSLFEQSLQKINTQESKSTLLAWVYLFMAIMFSLFGGLMLVMLL